MTTTKKITLAKIGKLVPIRLNMMVVGETGSGKTTFLRTLFKNYCEDEVVRAELTALTVKTVEIMEIGEFQIKSDAVACQVHLLDSPGFGDYIDNNCAINTVKEYLTKAHNSWLSSNSNLVPDEERSSLDNRIHCLFYFIAPHRIKHIDKEFIKHLNGLAPMVIVVAKADTMTWQERRVHLVDVRKMILELTALCSHPIAFDFQEEGEGFLDDETASRAAEKPAETPVHADPLDLAASMVFEGDFLHASSAEAVTASQLLPAEGDTTTATAASALRSSPSVTAFQSPVYLHAQARTHAPLPKVRNVFAVVCDTSDSGKREYPWGALDIYDEEHSDFRRLQRVILDSDNITEFIKQTQDMSLRLLRLESAATSESFPAAKMTSPEKTKAAGKKTPSAVGERSTETPRALSLTLPSQCAAPLTTGTAPTTAAARSEWETRSAGRAVRAQAIKWPQWSAAPESLHLITAASGGVLTILAIAALYSLWVVLAKIYSIEA